MAQLAKLIRGLSGHPTHPPLTDLTIGMFVLAAGVGIVGALIAAAPTALTGFADWLTLEWGSPTWRTATFHSLTMVTSVILFAIGAWLQWSGWQDGDVTGGGLALTVVGTGTLLVGGWLGGALVFVHGLRVENQSEETPRQMPAGDSQPS